MATHIAGRPSRDELINLVKTGEIDTIIVAITDMQGRVQGKRLDAPYFFDELAEGVVEGCSYLLASDVDMRTVDAKSGLKARSPYPRSQDVNAKPSTVRISTSEARR